MSSKLSFKKRAALCNAVMGQRLFKLCDEKKTNLALSADVSTAQELLTLADQLGPEICLLKTHIDIIADFTPKLTQALRELANLHQFLLFEDRKFADIGNTVKQQFASGIYRIADWADLINAHTLPGPGVIAGLKQALAPENNCGLLLLAEMSSKGNLLDATYREKTLQIAKEHADFVMGFITQHRLSSEIADLGFINITPGVQLRAGEDSLGQQYVTVEQAIIENGADIIIVGRGITAADDPRALAKVYRKQAFEAYLAR